MGLTFYRPFLFLMGVLAAACVIFPSLRQTHQVLRESRWTDYSRRESERLWNRNRDDIDAAVTLTQALRAQGQTGAAVKVAREALGRHPNAGDLERILLSLYNESNDMESLAALHHQLWDSGRVSFDSFDFLRNYYDERQNWPQMARLLEQAYARHPNANALPWDLIAYYERRRDLPRLQTIFIQRLKQNPRDPDALQGLITVYQESHQNDALAKLYERLLETSPNDVDVLTSLIALYEDDGTRVGLDLYERRARLVPQNSAYGLAYAQALVEEGQRDTAYQEVVRLTSQPNLNLSEISRLAAMALDQNWLDIAMPLVIRVAQTHTPAAPWWEQAAALADKSGDPLRARVFYEKAYAENPKSEAARALAELAFKDGDPQKAAEYWDAWLAGQPQDRAARLMIGDTLSIYNPAKAKSLYEDGLGIARKNEDPKDDLAYATLLLRLGQKREAYGVFKALNAKRHTFTPESLGDLTYLALQANDINAAEEALTRLEKWSPANPRAPALRAQLYLAQNKPLDALPILERLAKEEPRETDIKADLAWVYSELGNWKRAEQLYKDLLATRRQEEASQMLRTIADEHHARLDAETRVRLGPASKEEWIGGLGYRSTHWKGFVAEGSWRTHRLARRNAATNDRVIDWVQEGTMRGKIERRRWKMEAALSGYFGQKADALSPDGVLAYRTSDATLSLSGLWNQTLLDPSEALDVRGRQDLVRIDGSKRWGPWEAHGGGWWRGLRGEKARNPVTGENHLGHERGMEMGLTRILSLKAPYTSLGYTFTASKWSQPFESAGTLIPWLTHQRAHLATAYVEQPIKGKWWETVSAGLSGGRDVARQIWLLSVTADITGRLHHSWRWALGGGWAKDSGVVGSGSSTQWRARFIKLFGLPSIPMARHEAKRRE